MKPWQVIVFTVVSLGCGVVFGLWFESVLVGLAAFAIAWLVLSVIAILIGSSTTSTPTKHRRSSYGGSPDGGGLTWFSWGDNSNRDDSSSCGTPGPD